MQSLQGDSIARIFRTYSEGGLDIIDQFPLSRNTIKKESASPARPSPPRTPLPKRSKSMVESPSYISRGTRVGISRRKPVPLLSDINAFEARRSSPPSASLSEKPATSPRTPILRVKRQKRPLPSSRTVLKDTLKTNTPSVSPTTPLRIPAEASTRKRKAPSPTAAYTVAKSIRHLVGEQSRKSTRLVLVDGQDSENIARIRGEVMRRQSERADQVSIRLVDASMMESAADLSAATVDRFTICTI